MGFKTFNKAHAWFTHAAWNTVKYLQLMQTYRQMYMQYVKEIHF